MSNLREILKEIHQLLKNIVLTLMLWKIPNPPQRISSVSVRQGPSCCPSLIDHRCDCSPEGTHVIPREQYVSLLCPQISENWKIRRFCLCRVLFYPYQTRVIWWHWLYVRFVFTGSEIFIPDPILFMPDPIFICTRSRVTELLLTIPESSNIIVNRPLVWKLFVPGLKTQKWRRVTNWFREIRKLRVQISSKW